MLFLVSWNSVVVIWDIACEQVAKEQAERRATAQLMFDLGQRAYGKGTYSRAIEFFEGALTIIPPPTLFGGEVGILPTKGYVSSRCLISY